jgi:hypothetical protein
VVQEAALRGLGQMFQLLEGKPVPHARTFLLERLVREYGMVGHNGDYKPVYLYLITFPKKLPGNYGQGLVLAFVVCYL